MLIFFELFQHFSVCPNYENIKKSAMCPKVREIFFADFPPHSAGRKIFVVFGATYQGGVWPPPPNIWGWTTNSLETEGLPICPAKEVHRPAGS